MALRYNVHSTDTQTADGKTAGSILEGKTLLVNDNTRQKIGALSAIAKVDAETDTLTFAAHWQVSNDGTNWVDVANGPQNAASVALATGTSGADAEVVKAIDAPESVYAWRYARIVLVTGGATGAATDEYELSYCYRSLV